MTSIRAEYIDHLGDDLRVVNAARVSFDKESEWQETCSCGSAEPTYGWPCSHGGCDFHKLLSQPDTRLLGYLARHGHFTPFTHCQVTLREHVPIFVARQRFKHVVGFTYNEVSRRYVDEEPEFYTPEVWRGKAPSVKQGSSDEPAVSGGKLIMLQAAYRSRLADALATYRQMISDGVCPEQARMVLPQSMMTTYYVTGSLMAFARAYKQRSDTHAQQEIQTLAAEWDHIIRPLFPESWAALVCPQA